jgi:hypothetical protein
MPEIKPMSEPSSEPLNRPAHRPTNRTVIKPMNRVIPWVTGVVLLAGVGAAFYFLQEKRSPEPLPAPAAAVVPAPAPPAEPETHYPVPQPAPPQATAAPLPELNQSDPVAQDALATLIGAELLNKFLVPQEIVRHIVVTVDNLPRKALALRLSPVKPPGGEFRTTGKEGNLAIATDNAARYAPYVRIAEAVNAKNLVTIYGRLYPLFQKAYEDLGYPKGYFNDRLVVVIDHMLATPEVRGPIALVTPHVQAQFADPELEARSAGQKILLRIGSENAAVIKAKLREIRHELTGGNAQPAAARRPADKGDAPSLTY